LPDGHVDQSNIDVHYRPTDDKDPFQTDIFILSGKGEETFTPKFNYKGFQYIEINSSEPIELTQNSVKGYFMHSDVPAIGKITSSNPTLNKICATNRSYLSNLLAIQPIAHKEKKMAGQAMPILPAKQDFIILMALLSMRNGSPIIVTNNSPMVCFLQLFLREVGAMNGATDQIGLVR
jgi:hypothetical protein